MTSHLRNAPVHPLSLEAAGRANSSPLSLEGEGRGEGADRSNLPVLIFARFRFPCGCPSLIFLCGLLALASLVFSAPSPARADDQPILVGEFGSLTGSEATFGQTTHNGVKLAVEERNAAGGIHGRKIELKTYDDQGKSQEAGQAVTRLVFEDHAVAVLGEVASSLSLAGGEVCQKAGVPMISPSSTNPKVTQIGDMVFRVCFIDPFQGYAMAKFAHDNLKARNIAIFYDQKQAYSKGLSDAFQKALKKFGHVFMADDKTIDIDGPPPSILLIQSYTGGDADFSAQLTTIKEFHPDAIFIPGYYNDVGNIALQARKLGITCPLLGGDGWESPKLAEIAGKAIDGCYYSNHNSFEDKRPEVVAFLKKYKKAYGEEPGALSALGYDAANLLFDAMDRAKSLDGKDLAAAIAETKNFHGVTGTITINKDRNADKPAVILEFKEGRPKYVATIDPPK